MNCNVCKKPLLPIEETDNTGFCMRCELEYLRAYKKREEEHLKKLMGGPVWQKYVDGSPVHGNGCILNFI
jgi:predicted amidophosphoribosyltransferase